jgi:hypothetical protein
MPLAAALLVAPAPSAHAYNPEQQAGQDVCLALGAPPLHDGRASIPDYLTQSANQFLQNWFTVFQIGKIFGYASNACLQYHEVIEQTVSSWGAGNAPGPSGSSCNSADCVPNVIHNAVLIRLPDAAIGVPLLRAAAQAAHGALRGPCRSRVVVVFICQRCIDEIGHLAYTLFWAGPL